MVSSAHGFILSSSSSETRRLNESRGMRTTLRRIRPRGAPPPVLTRELGLSCIHHQAGRWGRREAARWPVKTLPGASGTRVPPLSPSRCPAQRPTSPAGRQQAREGDPSTGGFCPCCSHSWREFRPVSFPPSGPGPGRASGDADGASSHHAARLALPPPDSKALSRRVSSERVMGFSPPSRTEVGISHVTPRLRTLRNQEGRTVQRSLLIPGLLWGLPPGPRRGGAQGWGHCLDSCPDR